MLRVSCLSVCLLCVLALGLQTGCGRFMPQPSQQEMATWDYGPYPDNYKEIVMASPKLRTNDSEKPRLEFQGAPKKRWVNEGSGFLYGWCGTVRRFGGESGTMIMEYVIRNGQLLRLQGENDNRLIRIN